MTHHSDTHDEDPGSTDDALREAQAGKGYGEDEGEREHALESDETESPIEGP